MRQALLSGQLKVWKSISILAIILGAAVVARIIVHRESHYLGQPASHWIKRARAGDASQSTTTALEGLGAEAIVPLLKTMIEKDSALQKFYLRSYGSLPAWTSRFLPQPQPGQQVRDNCYMVLSRVSAKGVTSYALVTELIKLVNSDDRRSSGIFVDANTHQALPHGIYVRALAADMLSEMGPNAAAAVPMLVQRLRTPRSPQDYLFDRIPRALGYIGPAAHDAIPALKELLSGQNLDTALWAGEALWKIDPGQAPFVVPVAENALRHTNAFTRLKAARVHWEIERKATVVMPVLIGLLNDKANLWVIDTLRALENIGPEATDALPLLAEKQEDTDPVVRIVAQEVRARIESTVPRPGK